MRTLKILDVVYANRVMYASAYGSAKIDRRDMDETIIVTASTLAPEISDRVVRRKRLVPDRGARSLFLKNFLENRPPRLHCVTTPSQVNAAIWSR